MRCHALTSTSTQAGVLTSDRASRATARLQRCCSFCSGTPRDLLEERTTSDWKYPFQRISGKPAVVALGKFDALHKGHRALAAQAADMGGYPWLLAFSGMAQVLGWPTRPSLVADSDRARVLESWAVHCQGLTPYQRFLPFAAVRNMKPDEFVRLLADDLQVAGICVGEGYRFGYKQAGDTAMLQRLGKQAGLDVRVVELVQSSSLKLGDKVSSSEVRQALSRGLMSKMRDYLDRPYRLVANPATCQRHDLHLWIPAAAFQNQAPKLQEYNALLHSVSENGSIPWSPPRRVIVEESGARVTILSKDSWLEELDSLRAIALDFM